MLYPSHPQLNPMDFVGARADVLLAAWTAAEVSGIALIRMIVFTRLGCPYINTTHVY